MIVLSLWGDYVAKLEVQPAQRCELLRVEEPANSHFHVGAHTNLRGLRCRYFVDALFDEVLVERFGIKRLIEGDVRFPQTAVGILTFVASVGGESPNLLTLFGRQVQLLDRIGGRWRRWWLLGQR